MSDRSRIAGAKTGLVSPNGLIVDAAKQLRVANANGQITWYRSGTNGNSAPIGRLGPGAGLTNPQGLNFDSAGHLLVADQTTNQVSTYANQAAGATVPLSSLAVAGRGSNVAPIGLDLDAAGDLFVAASITNTINEYPPGATGFASPPASIRGPDTGLGGPAFLSELPPPPAPRLTAHTDKRASIRQFLRSAITIRLTAGGRLAFRSGPLKITATAGLGQRIIATGRITLTTPGHTLLVLRPVESAARRLRQTPDRRVIIRLTLHDGAGVQTRRVTLKLTR